MSLKVGDTFTVYERAEDGSGLVEQVQVVTEVREDGIVVSQAQ